MATHGSQKFLLFSLLPPELRLKIWGHALDHSRIVVVTVPSIVGCVPEDDCNCCALAAKPQIPSLLLVNHESRAVAVPKYKLSFSSPVSAPHYFNFDADILFIRGQGLCYASNHISAKIHHMVEMKKVTNLAMSWEELDLHFLSPELDFGTLGKSLEKLIVVMNAVPKGKGTLKLDSDLKAKKIPMKRLRAVQVLRLEYFHKWKQLYPEWKEPAIEMAFLIRER